MAHGGSDYTVRVDLIEPKRQCFRLLFKEMLITFVGCNLLKDLLFDGIEAGFEQRMQRTLTNTMYSI